MKQQLSADDLRVDPILVRKIKRMQRAELEETQLDSDSDDGETEQAPAPVSSRPTGRVASVKMQTPSTQGPPQSSIIEDLGDPSDDE